jgi:hypothetical protein
MFSLYVSFRFESYRLVSHRLMLIILLVYVSFRFVSTRLASGRIGLSLRILIPEKQGQELLVWKPRVPRFDVAINLLDLAWGGK